MGPLLPNQNKLLPNHNKLLSNRKRSLPNNSKLLPSHSRILSSHNHKAALKPQPAISCSQSTTSLDRATISCSQTTKRCSLNHTISCSQASTAASSAVSTKMRPLGSVWLCICSKACGIFSHSLGEDSGGPMGPNGLENDRVTWESLGAAIPCAMGMREAQFTLARWKALLYMRGTARRSAVLSSREHPACPVTCTHKVICTRVPLYHLAWPSLAGPRKAWDGLRVSQGSQGNLIHH